VGGRVLAETQVRGAALWSVTVPLDLLTAADGRIVIATNRTFVPADESGVADRRALGLRTFGVTIATQP
jgi:hypothetical protein